MKATELHARLGGTLHTLSAASWALHVSRWRPSTPARFDAEWELHPAERREVVVFNRRCYENRYSRAFGDVAYAYAGQVAQASPIESTTPCGELLAACNAALNADLNSCLQNWYEPDHWLGDHSDDERALVPSAPVASVFRGALRGASRSSRGRRCPRPSKRTPRTRWRSSCISATAICWSWAAPASRRTCTASRSGRKKMKENRGDASPGRSVSSGRRVTCWPERSRAGVSSELLRC